MPEKGAAAVLRKGLEAEVFVLWGFQTVGFTGWWSDDFSLPVTVTTLLPFTSLFVSPCSLLPTCCSCPVVRYSTSPGSGGPSHGPMEAAKMYSVERKIGLGVPVYTTKRAILQPYVQLVPTQHYPDVPGVSCAQDHARQKGNENSKIPTCKNETTESKK